MELLNRFFESFINYPKSTLLFVIVALNLIWVFYIFFLKKGFRDNIYRGYFLYSFFAIAWVITNAYFQSQFLMTTGPEFAKYMALLANISIALAGVGFYYISCAVKTPKISIFSWIFMGLIVLEALVLNLIPGLTVQKVIIYPDSSFQLVQGPWTGLFFLIGLFVIFVSSINFIQGILRNQAKIENIRAFYILFGMSILYSSIIVCLIIYPYYFQDYSLAWIPPILSLADIVIMGYAIVTKRFLDIRTLMSRFFKVIIAFALSSLIGFNFIIFIAEKFGTLTLRQWEFIGAGLIVFLFNRFINLFNSRTFYTYFGGTDAERIQYVVNDLRKSKKIYTSIQNYQNDLTRTFRNHLQKIQPQIIIVDKIFKKNYPYLDAYLTKNRQIIVTEEIKFAEKNKSLIPLLKELESLGGLCIPLFNPTRGLVALFSLGKKNYNHLFFKDEIGALESLGSYLTVTVNSILYNFELQAEVDKKTKELKRKIDQINELVQQQSDFIAVTAHEFRTPLSIASFQLDDILTSDEPVQKKINELKVVESSIENLKQLTEKLFTIQQYDLNKVELNLKAINIKDFIKKIYSDFLPYMKGKDILLNLDIQSKKKILIKIDPIQMRQVLHNLITNAFKFTPAQGHVTLGLKKQEQAILIFIKDNGPGIPNDLKKTIFEKFRTKSSGAGIGLGLYLCKKTIELHGGRIWVEDNQPQGAIFCIQLKID